MGWRRREEKLTKLAIKVLVRGDKAVDKGNNPLGSFLPFLIEYELVMHIMMNRTFFLNHLLTERRGELTDQNNDFPLSSNCCPSFRYCSSPLQRDCAHRTTHVLPLASPLTTPKCAP